MEVYRYPDKTKELSELIVKQISMSREVKAVEVRHIPRILARFLRYSIDACIHGYPIQKSVRGKEKRFSFEFRYIFVKKIPHHYKKKISFSSKAFGYFFILDIFWPAVSNNRFRYSPKPEFLREVAAITESNKVYDLIRKKDEKNLD